jgi:DNA-binding NarL/FixJ family response regulator
MDTTIQTLNILIVDDHQMFVDGIISLIRENSRINKIYKASNGKNALEIIKSQKIDLVITDLNMPEMSGLELTLHIKADHPEIKILVLTMYNDKPIVKEIIDTEAEGYILKNKGTSELENAIEKIADGGTYYSNEVYSILMEEHREKNKHKFELSERELEILKLICKEFSTSEIAEKLFISPTTVETHRRNMYQKTKSKNIVGLIKYAISSNLI